ncbi:MAG: hypothetical protein ACLTOJ_17360 [[Clostridium] symbiosum]
MFLRSAHDDYDIEIDMIFNDWVGEENRRRPFRKISNVKILEIKLKAFATLPLAS